MKVADLIEELKYMPQDADVHFTYNYGDHWRTQVAPKVSEVFDGLVEHSEYHRMPKLKDEYDEDEEDNTQATRVVIIG